jgi:hypothetical protein
MNQAKEYYKMFTAASTFRVFLTVQTLKVEAVSYTLTSATIYTST